MRITEGAQLLEVGGVPSYTGLLLEPAHGRALQVLVGLHEAAGEGGESLEGMRRPLHQ